MDLSPIFDLSFWFDLRPNALSQTFQRVFFFLFSGMILLGAVARMSAKNKKDKLEARTWKRVAALLLTMGFAGFVYLFFAFEEIYLFSARFWFLLWVAGVIVWIVSIVRYARVTVPEKREEIEARSAGNEYLPRKNRR